MRRSRPTELDEVESRFDLQGWVERNLTIASRSGPELTCVCPLCGKPKLAIHTSRRAYQCWSAGCKLRGWSPIVLVSDCLGIDFAEAYAIAEASIGGVVIGPVGGLDKRSHARGNFPNAPLPPGTTWRLLGRGYEYAASRGISPANMRSFRIGYAEGDGSGSKSDRILRDRLVFPVIHQDRVIYWAARACTSDRSKIKVVNLPKPCKDPERHELGCACYHREWKLPEEPRAALAGEVVMGLHLVTPGSTVYVVEGPVDAAVCGPGFVSTFGAHATMAQVAAIAAIASKAVFLFDDDDGGRKGLRRALLHAQGVIPCEGVVCPVGLDPAEMGRERAIAWCAERSRSQSGTIAPLRIRSDQPVPTHRRTRIIRPLGPE